MDTGILEFSSYSRRGDDLHEGVLLALEPAGADGRAHLAGAHPGGPATVRWMELVVFGWSP